MKPLMLLLAIGSLLDFRVAAAVEDDPVEMKLTAAKEEYERSLLKARETLLSDLKKKEETAQKAGDLKTLEKIQAETKAFETGETLPKTVSARGYESLKKTARAKLEDGFTAAIKQFTKDGKVAQAKATQEELDEFKNAAPFIDPFQAKSLWVRDAKKLRLRVLERNGESFKAQWSWEDINGKDFGGKFAGSIKEGKFSWAGKEIRVTEGELFPGTKQGTITRDKEGARLDLFWQDATGKSGTYTLRLSKGK